MATEKLEHLTENSITFNTEESSKEQAVSRLQSRQRLLS